MVLAADHFAGTQIGVSSSSVSRRMLVVLLPNRGNASAASPFCCSYTCVIGLTVLAVGFVVVTGPDKQHLQAVHKAHLR